MEKKEKEERKQSWESVETIAGGDGRGFEEGKGSIAKFNECRGIVEKDGVIFVADCDNHRIRRIERDGMVSTFAGTGKRGNKDGDPKSATFVYPKCVGLDRDGTLLVGEFGGIRMISPQGMVSTLVKTPDSERVNGICVSNDGHIYVSTSGLFSTSRIYELNKNSKSLILIAGTGEKGWKDGDTSVSQFYSPQGIGVDSDGNLIIADQNNHVIRKILMREKKVITIAGVGGKEGFKDGDPLSALFNGPNGVVVDGDDNIYVADCFNKRIRMMKKNGNVETIAGNGEEKCKDGDPLNASFWWPRSICLDGFGNLLVGEDGAVRRINKKKDNTTTPKVTF